MLQNVPQIGRAKPRLLVHLKCLTFIVVQILGPNTLYLAETDNALMATSDNPGQQDALQINQAAGIVGLWWRGDLWAAGSTTFAPLIIIPGINTGSALPDVQGISDNAGLKTTPPPPTGYM